MKSVRLMVGVCVAGLLVVATARAQEPAKPGPEHAKLKELVGTWDATVKMMGQESKATCTYRMGLGDLWLLSNFNGDFGGMKFTGHGVDGYDTAKKKYVGFWVDSMSTGMIQLEGEYDAEKKVLTMTGDSVGPDGKPVKMKTTSEMPDKDTIVFKMFMGGTPEPMMTINYKRKPQEKQQRN
jgi:hypothetical protein